MERAIFFHCIDRHTQKSFKLLPPRPDSSPTAASYRLDSNGRHHLDLTRSAKEDVGWPLRLV